MIKSLPETPKLKTHTPALDKGDDLRNDFVQGKEKGLATIIIVLKGGRYLTTRLFKYGCKCLCSTLLLLA